MRENLEPRVMNDLVVLARMSDTLLDQQCDTHPDDRREAYLVRLDRVGLLNRTAEAKLPALATAMDGYWGGTLEFWPRLTNNGRCTQKWLGALL